MSPESPASGRVSPLLLRTAAFLFCSGACALVAQTAWLRELRLIFGASTPANAAVLAIFMGGLGLGGFVLGRKVERVSRPLALYGMYEIVVGVTCALTPFLVDAARAAYRALGGADGLGSGGATLARLALSVLVLGVPVFVMGGTFPAAARAVTATADTSRRALALLYGVNTLGAVAGTLVTTFIAFEAIGVRATLWIGCGLNVAVGVLARSVGRALPQQAPVSSARGGSRAIVVPTLAALTGFVFLLSELVWYRMLAPLLGGSQYSFGLVLACALAGVGVGGALYSFAAGRGSTLPPPDASKPAGGATFGAFAITCALQAALLMAPLALGDRVAYLTADLHAWGASSFATLATSWTVVTCLVVLPPALVAGYQFPLLIALRGQGRSDIGKDVGDVYAANTVGSIAGSLAGGFGLIPFWSATGAWRLCGALLVIAAVVVALATARAGAAGPRLRAVAALALAFVAVALTLAPGPSAVWRHSGIGAGRDKLGARDPNARAVFRTALERNLTDVADGVESSIATHVANGSSLLVNGKSDGNSYTDAPTGVGAGLIAALLHPSGDPRRAFIVGLGSGQTPGWLAAVPSIERVDVAEIEPGVVRYAEHCKETNLDAMSNPKVHVHIGDGRERLLASDDGYDIIVSEPSNPYRAGVASLYTQELYRGALAHLAPGGIFAQWVQAYELEPSTMVMVLATMRTVFSDVSIWQLSPSDLLVIASQQPVTLDVTRVEAAMAAEPYRTAFGRIFGVHGAAGFAALSLANDAGTRWLVRGVDNEINTDDLPLLEARFVRSVGTVGVDLGWVLHGVLSADQRSPALVNGALAREAIALQQLRVHAWRAVLPAPRVAELPPLARAYITRTAPPADAAPADGVDEVFLASALLSTHATRDARFAATLASLEARPGFAGDAALLRLGAALMEQRAADVEPLLARVVELLAHDAWPNLRVAQDVLGTLLEKAPPVARWIDLAKTPFAGDVFHEQKVVAAINGERALAAQSGAWRPQCVATFGLAEPHPLWSRTILQARVACYEAHAAPELARAQADLAQFIADDPAP